MDVINRIAARVAPSLAVLALAGHAHAFSQNSPVTPIGHETITMFAWAQDLGIDPNDPTNQMLASLSNTTGAGMVPRGAVLGVRWVDLMGYAFLNPWGSTQVCWNIVAQVNADVQYDHALRTALDTGEEGRRRTIIATISRARRNYLAALNVTPGATLTVLDGGAAGDTYNNVDAGSFYLGNALHQMEDSYSHEHSRRGSMDMNPANTNDPTRTDLVIWLDAKTYTCAGGMWQHVHNRPSSSDTNRDVIWITSGNGRDSSHYYGQTTFLMPYAVTAINGAQSLYRAYRMARLMSGTDTERGAVFDREVLATSFLFALDPLWATAPTAGCAASDAAEQQMWTTRMECTREQCLDGIEAANAGLSITTLRPPTTYSSMAFSPTSCADPSPPYTH